MKPRITLAEAALPNGGVLSLLEHDSRHYLQSDSIQIAGPGSARTERELAHLACAPFRSLRQPKIWVAGLGLGELLAGVTEALSQKKGVFIVAEPQPELIEWQRQYFPDGAFVTDPRVELETSVAPAALRQHGGELHAILLHADTAPLTPDGRLLFEDLRWLGAAYDALQPGGLLAVASAQKLKDLEKIFARVGFETVRHEIDAVPNARRPRFHYAWLAKKGAAPEPK